MFWCLHEGEGGASMQCLRSFHANNTREQTVKITKPWALFWIIRLVRLWFKETIAVQFRGANLVSPLVVKSPSPIHWCKCMQTQKGICCYSIIFWRLCAGCKHVWACGQWLRPSSSQCQGNKADFPKAGKKKKRHWTREIYWTEQQCLE